MVKLKRSHSCNSPTQRFKVITVPLHSARKPKFAQSTPRSKIPRLDDVLQPKLPTVHWFHPQILEELSNYQYCP